jgi:hypothetical protein
MKQLLAASFTIGLAFAIPAQAQPVVGVQPQRAAVAPVNERNAGEVRNELQQLLREYPPTLAQVLRLDPSLLTREGYLAPYPSLAGYIAQHPEIPLQPVFYLGSPEFENENRDAPVAREVRQALVNLIVLGGIVAVLLTFAWVVRTAVDHRRWLRVSKTQTEAHSKLLDRLTSNEDLLAYIQSPAGQHFLQSAPIPLDARPRSIGAPFGRILGSVQAGIVLAVVGIGLWFARNLLVVEISAAVGMFAVLTLALGMGFVLSAGAAYLLSQRLGLLETPKT